LKRTGVFFAKKTLTDKGLLALNGMYDAGASDLQQLRRVNEGLTTTGRRTSRTSFEFTLRKFVIKIIKISNIKSRDKSEWLKLKSRSALAIGP